MTVKAEWLTCVLLAGWVSACGDPPAALREQLARQQERIEQLEHERSRMQDRHAQELEQLRQTLADRHQTEMEDVRSTLQRDINEASRRIHALRRQVEEVTVPSAKQTERPPPAAPPAPPPGGGAPPISGFRAPPPDLSAFIEPPSGPDPDLFPLRISNVRGTPKVIGTVASSRPVETGETYKDPFGEERPVLRQQAIETKQYEYEVLFEARNRTRNPLSLEFRAGRERVSATLEPGESRILSVPSLRGADLVVTAGGDRRSFHVPYP